LRRVVGIEETVTAYARWNVRDEVLKACVRGLQDGLTDSLGFKGSEVAVLMVSVYYSDKKQ